MVVLVWKLGVGFYIVWLIGSFGMGCGNVMFLMMFVMSWNWLCMLFSVIMRVGFGLVVKINCIGLFLLLMFSG